jgi:hypothetical protein
MTAALILLAIVVVIVIVARWAVKPSDEERRMRGLK